MNLNADKSTQTNNTHISLVLLIVFGLLMLRGSTGYGQDGPVRAEANEAAVGIRLPPRSRGHESGIISSRKSSSSGSLWTTTLSLAAIVGSVTLVGYWLKPYLGLPRTLPIEAMELLGRRMIEQKVAIHLVRCGERVLVLGVSPDGARTLAEITDPGEVQRMVDACQQPRDAKSFTVRGTTNPDQELSAEAPRRG
ncbi:MAG: flagellar biosynthetic protein FliO [Planctomycetes bacterium]|nr:flagellar biosynthetic protein FliO [Planctomycetota bacterium]